MDAYRRSGDRPVIVARDNRLAALLKQEFPILLDVKSRREPARRYASAATHFAVPFVSVRWIANRTSPGIGFRGLTHRQSSRCFM